jgi:ribosomal protein L32
LSKCPKCGELFTKDRFPICPVCKTRENEQLDTLRRYTDHNPDATMEELEKISGLTKDQIIVHIREGRLISMNARQIMLNCEQCGAEIMTGHFCRTCKTELADRLAASVQGLKAKKQK